MLSFGALLIEGRAFARYADWRDLGRLMVAATAENFGYRQWLTVIRARAWWTVLRPSRGWGEMVRAGIGDGRENLNPQGALPAGVTVCCDILADHSAASCGE